MLGRFGEIFIKETIPMIDSTYRTFGNYREHRAMARLSMGGGRRL